MKIKEATEDIASTQHGESEKKDDGRLHASYDEDGLLDARLKSVLRTRFHISKLYNFQIEILHYLSKSFASSTPYQDAVCNDLCVYVPTGYGKTLAYVLPSLSLFINHANRLSLPGVQVMILVPTRELVYQVFHVYKCFLPSLENQISVAVLTGDLKEAKERALLQGLVGPRKLRRFTAGAKPAFTGPHILIALASRISPHLPPVADKPSFHYKHLRLFIIDEADRLLEQSYGDWLFATRAICEEKDRHRGFVPEPSAQTADKSILQYGTFGHYSDVAVNDSSWKRQIFDSLTPAPLHKIALTATNVQNYKGFGLLMLKAPIQIVGILREKEVERIRHYYVKGYKSPDLVRKILNKQKGRSLIFCMNDALCLWLRRELLERKLAVDVLSGSRTSKERREAVKCLRKGLLNGLICTDLASRGLDIENISTIIHYELPQTAESYIHRVGRAGRAGAKGKSFAIAENASEVRNLVKVIKSAQKYRACELKRYTKLDK